MNKCIKEGNLVNIVSYEHVCDTEADLEEIPMDQRTMYSTAYIVHGAKVYMADGTGAWIEQ